nr:Dihydrofolate reductase [uncultured bacterium]
MIVSLIAGLTRNRVIGKNNDLPWHLPDDMKFFMNTTLGHAVIMGRKNFDSLPPKFKPLRDRYNIVISAQPGYKASGAVVVSSWNQALAEAKANTEREEIFVIGGAQIYLLAMQDANRLYLTEIDATIDGDTYFPEIDKSEWIERSRTHHAVDNKHQYAFDFVVYDRRFKSLR